LVQLIRSLLNEGRPVYVHGLEGLQPFGWEPCDAREWQSLPDGSVIVVDEAQKVWPTRRAGEPGAEIRALSEHRHHGLDFVLATQHPTMLDTYVRKLVGEHEHVLRQFGMEASRIVTWSECQDDPQSLGTRKRGTDRLWKYPRDCFGLYKSATLHTVKRRIPLRLKLIPALVLVAAGAAWYGIRTLSGLSDAAPEVAPAVAVADGASSAIAARREVPVAEDAAEYLERFVPRVPGMPWSAPAFDSRQVLADPQVLCVQSEVHGCQCYTEQITRLNVDLLQCLKIARDGVYNPFRAPIQQQGSGGRQPPSQSSQPVARVATPDSLPLPRSVPAQLVKLPMDAGSAWPSG
jgi:hypothetical protein